jgi:hypothetical protein
MPYRVVTRTLRCAYSPSRPLACATLFAASLMTLGCARSKEGEGVSGSGPSETQRLSSASSSLVVSARAVAQRRTFDELLSELSLYGWRKGDAPDLPGFERSPLLAREESGRMLREFFEVHLDADSFVERVKYICDRRVDEPFVAPSIGTAVSVESMADRKPIEVDCVRRADGALEIQWWYAIQSSQQIVDLRTVDGVIVRSSGGDQPEAR